MTHFWTYYKKKKSVDKCLLVNAVGDDRRKKKILAHDVGTVVPLNLVRLVTEGQHAFEDGVRQIEGQMYCRDETTLVWKHV